jgi:phage head maturation protease
MMLTRSAPEIPQRDQKQKNNNTRDTADVAIRALEDQEGRRRFELSFCSEEPYERWFGTEILDCSEEAVDLTRLNSIGCVLFNHDRDEVVAKILRAWLADGRGYAEIEFDSDDESEKIYQKVSSGTLKGVSVGYTVSNWEEVASGEQSADGRFAGPCSIARKWAPLEISIVSVPADPTVGVGREMEDPSEPTPETPEIKPGHADDLRARQLRINLNSLL